MTLAVITFKWQQVGYHSEFNADQVNRLARMVRRHYPHDHRFICVTDDPHGIAEDVECVPLWNDYANLKNPSVNGGPSCYRRLKIFSRDAGEVFGDRIVSLDLDTVIVGDLTPLWDIDADFKIWGDTSPRTWYNGSMFYVRAGARACLWDEFDPVQSPILAKRAGKLGSDQAWISYRLGPGEQRWSQDDGVYSWRVHLAPNGGALPNNAVVVNFHGKDKPWTPRVYDRHEWIRRNWR